MFVTPVVAGDLVYTASCNGSVYAFERATGRVRWRHDSSADGPSANFHGSVVLTDELLLIGGDAEPFAHLYAFERASGRVRWKRRFDGGLYVDLLRRGDWVLGVTRRGDAFALDLATGEPRWRFTGGPRQTARPPGRPALVGDLFVVPARQGDVIAVRVETGEQVWRRTLPAELRTGLTLAGGALLVGAADGALYRLDPADGRVLGSLTVGAMSEGTIVEGPAGVFVVAEPDGLACLAADLSAVHWRAARPGGWSSPRPLVLDDLVVVGTEGGEVVGFDAEGREAWSVRLEGEVRAFGADGDLVLVGTRPGDLFAVRLSTD